MQFQLDYTQYYSDPETLNSAVAFAHDDGKSCILPTAISVVLKKWKELGLDRAGGWYILGHVCIILREDASI